MKFKSKIIKNTEPILLIGLWIIVFVAPLLVFQEDDTLGWGKVMNAWRGVIPFLVLFLINHFILVPLLLFKNKKAGYIISAAILVTVFSMGMYFFESNKHPNQVLRERPELPPAHRPAIPQTIKPPPPAVKNGPMQLPLVVNTFIVCILIVGFDTGLRMIVRWSRSERERTIMEKENVQNQLAFLRNQVSPHFLMNTLNNIHVLIDINTEEAKDAVIKLSKLMRHLLYESNENLVPVKQEFEFITSYINLMKLRYSDRVDINLKIPTEIPEKKIPPLLFISFVENAFKHGISYQMDSFIDINFSFDTDNLNFRLKNSIADGVKNNSTSGIGMENSVRRLDILYGKDYSLDITTSENEYKLNLSIPI